MAVLKVHGNVYSTAAMRVFACLHEKELEFEFFPVKMRGGEDKKEHFISLNPFSQVPAFEDGDVKLFESRAITRYIALEYAESGTQLIHDDIVYVAIGMDVEAYQFNPPASKLTWELAVKPAFGLVTDGTIVEENEEKLAKVLDVYDARLSQSKYLAGDSFTLADLHHLPEIHYLMGTTVRGLFQSRPHVSAWCDDIMARPAWSKVVQMKKKT